MAGNSWEGALPFFSESELACSHCGKILLNLHFASAVVTLRYLWGRPLTPSSVCRCPTHNEAVGGHPRSLHLTENPVHESHGCAAMDVLWESWPTSDKIAFAREAWKLGFSLGFNRIFCHIDLRAKVSASMPQHIFHYSNWPGLFDDDEVK
jgi:hypothetical protein